MCYLKNVWYYCPLFPWLQMLRWFCQFYESFIRSTYRSDCMSVDLDDEWDKERWPLCNSWFLFKTYKNYITLDDVSGHFLCVWLVMFNIFNETFQLLIKIKSKRFLWVNFIVGGNSIVEAWTLDIAWKFHGACFVTKFAGTVCGYTLLLLIFF